MSVQFHQQSSYSMLTFVHHSLKSETEANLWERGVGMSVHSFEGGLGLVQYV